MISSVVQYALQNIGKNIMVKSNVKHKKLLEETIYYGKLLSVKDKDNITILQMKVYFIVILYSRFSMKMAPYKISILIKEKDIDIDNFTSINTRFEIFNIYNYLNHIVKEIDNNIFNSI